MIATLKRWAKQGALRLGYDVMRVAPPGWAPYYLERLGFCPETVVDVGVGFGTPALYQAFPRAHHVLIEPLAEFEPHVRAILRRYRGEYHLTALGAGEEERRIQIDPTWTERSSLLRRTALEAGSEPLVERVVPVTSLDALLDRQGFRPPFGLKLDVEGFELQVIAGAERFLRATEFVIAEVAVAERFAGGYAFTEFIRVMDGRGFRLRDILDIGRAENSEMTFVDAVFAKV